MFFFNDYYSSVVVFYCEESYASFSFFSFVLNKINAVFNRSHWILTKRETAKGEMTYSRTLVLSGLHILQMDSMYSDRTLWTLRVQRESIEYTKLNVIQLHNTLNFLSRFSCFFARNNSGEN